MSEEETINSRSYRLKKALENDLDRINGPNPDSLDSTTSTRISGQTVAKIHRDIPITLAANNRVSQIQYVANVLMRSMRKGIMAMAAFCSLHSTLLFAQTDQKGTYYRDYASNFHGPPYDSRCTVYPIPQDMLFQLMDSEEPRVNEFFNLVTQVKEALDRNAAKKSITESKKRYSREIVE
jgi:hypothetical protein